ncbi:MAG: DUF2807 domain-containing protein [Bacteroidota bacterium]|nr:MAG: DUF2807 domain-containing protein [Bacteroidota bacterium]
MKKIHLFSYTLPTLFVVFLLAPAFLQAQAEKRNVENFNQISYSISGKLILVQSEKYELTLEGQKSDLEKIITRVEGNTLVIKTNDYANLKDEVIVRVSLPQLTELNLAGSGHVMAGSAFKAEVLELMVTGSGNIDFSDLQCKSLSAEVTGSGNIQAKGKAANASLEITGSGNINLEPFEVSEAEVSITGSGSARVYAIDKLETNITGSGNVRYKGQPLIDANTVGSGTTRSL